MEMIPLSMPTRLTLSGPTLYRGSVNASSADTASHSSCWECMRGVRTRQSSMALATCSSRGIR